MKRSQRVHKIAMQALDELNKPTCTTLKRSQRVHKIAMQALDELNKPTCTTLPADSTARKEIPLFRGPLRYFPAALAGVARVCKVGNDKHNPGEEMHHARGKPTDHADCILRHLVDLSEDFGAGVGRDEGGMPQVDYIVWRAMALAQQWHEEHDGAPLAPGARLPK